MGDFSAIAAVTRTLAQVIQDGVNRCEGDIARATITTARPDRSDGNSQPRVNLFMFHASPNPYLRNDDLPVLSQNGLLHRPAVALDLFYLVSFYGNDELTRAESQVLMGITMATLNAHPVFSSAAIDRAAAAFDVAVDPRFAMQAVQLTLQNLSVEELSRLWSTFPLVPYTPSICYRASPVVIEADEIPVAVFPVQRMVVDAPARPVPVVSGVRGGDGVPPAYGRPIIVDGRNLGGEDVCVHLGDAVLRPLVHSASGVTVQADGDGVVAGVQSLQVESDGQLSAPAALALAPLVASCSAEMQSIGRRDFAGTIVVALQPLVQPDQSLVLELFPVRSSLFGSRRSYRFEWIRRPETAQPNVLRLPVKLLGEGSYVVRVTVDGAASLLAQDARGRYTGPVVTIGSTPGEEA